MSCRSSSQLLAPDLRGQPGTQDGIARAFNWIEALRRPGYRAHARPDPARHGGGATFFGRREEAATRRGRYARRLCRAPIWLTSLAQGVLLDRQLARDVAPGPRAYEALRPWIKTSLPIRHGAQLLISCSPMSTSWCSQPCVGPGEVAVYYAATKTLTPLCRLRLYFSVSAATAPAASTSITWPASARKARELPRPMRFSGRSGVAPRHAGVTRDRQAGAGAVRRRFRTGLPLMFVLAVSLLAPRSAVERLPQYGGRAAHLRCGLCRGFAFNLVLSAFAFEVMAFRPLGAIATASALVMDRSHTLHGRKRRRSAPMRLRLAPYAGVPAVPDRHRIRRPIARALIDARRGRFPCAKPQLSRTQRRALDRMAKLADAPRRRR